MTTLPIDGDGQPTRLGPMVNTRSPSACRVGRIDSAVGLAAVLALLLVGCRSEPTETEPADRSRAAERGHADIVQRLLETDIDVNHINNLGWTALHEAIILGDGTDRYVRTIQLLLNHDADPNLPTGTDGHSPLTLAEERNQTAVVELLRILILPTR